MREPYYEPCHHCGHLRIIREDDVSDVDGVSDSDPIDPSPEPVDHCLCWPDEVACLTPDWDED